MDSKPPDPFTTMQRNISDFHIITVHGVTDTHETIRAHSQDRENTASLESFIHKRHGPDRTTNFCYRSGDWFHMLFRCFHDVAMDLLKTLSVQSTESRSLVFIGRDIGGLIIKQALLIALNNEKYSFVAERAAFLVFIGTPHRATNVESWENIAVKLMLKGPLRNDSSFSRDLKPFSRALIRLSKSFEMVARMYKIMSFYADCENTSMESLEFPEEISTMGVPGEDTRAMKKRIDETNEVLKQNENLLNLIVQKRRAAEIGTLQLHCLRTLSMVDSAHHLTSVHTVPHYLQFLSCGFAQEAYKKCCDSLRFPLWIHSQLRSNLAVAMSALETEARKPLSNTNVIKFSFNSQDDRYCSTYGMLASLSLQLLMLKPALFDNVKSLYEKISKEIPWRIDRLWAFFRSLLSCPSRGDILCLVNLVDECDSSRSQFLEEFLCLSSSERFIGAFRLVVTSRKAPGTKFESGATVVSADLREEKNAETIGEERENTLSREIHDLYRARPELEKFDDIIRRRILASMDVVNASIVLGLLRARQAQSTHGTLSTELNSIPCTQFGVYQHFLNKIPTDKRQWSSHVLSCIIRAWRPLTLVELSVVLALNDRIQSISDLQNNIPQDLALDLKQTFGNLIQIENDEVLFVDRSFPEFILAAQHEQHENNYTVQLDDHSVFAQASIRYLSLIAEEWHRLQSENRDGENESLLEDLQAKGDEYSFIAYAALYWPRHYNLATHERYPDLHDDACAFLEKPKSVRIWSSLEWSFGNPLKRPRFSFRNPLPIAVRFRCRDLVRTLIRKPNLDRNDLPTALEISIENGDGAIIKDLRDAGASSPWELHQSALHGREQVVAEILATNMSQLGNPNIEAGLYSSSPLHLASTAGYHSLVHKFLHAGFDKDAKDNEGMTPLHLASEFGHVNVMEELLRWKADVNMQAKNQQTALHLSCLLQQPYAVAMLLAKGVNIRARDEGGRTALHLAAESGREDIVEILLSHCETLDKQNKETQVVGQVIGNVDDNFSTPLHLAARKGHTKVVSKLLARNKEYVEAAMKQDESGDTPLHVAAKNGHEDVVKELIDNNKRRERMKETEHSSHMSNIEVENRKWQAPIHLAVLSGDVSIVTMLCKEHRRQKVSLDVFDMETRSPLHMAARGGLTDIVRALLKYGALADIADENAETPLLLACENGHLKIVILLLQAGADPICTNSRGRSALHQAAEAGATAVMRELLNASRKLVPGSHYANLRDSTGSTPLHIAAEAGSIEGMQILLDENADVNCLDGRNRNLLYLASQRNHPEMVAWLLKKMKDFQTFDTESSSSGQGHSEILKTLLEAQPDQDYCGETSTETSKSHLREALNELLDGLEHSLNPAECGPILHLSAKKGIEEVVSKILAIEGVDPNVADKDGRTALIFAAKNGRCHLVQLLLKRSEIESNRDHTDEDSRSAISYAAENGHLEIVESLASKRRSKMDSDTYQGTLSYAAGAGHAKIVEYLLGQKSLLNSDEDRRSLLNRSLKEAIFSQNIEIVRLLLDYGADANNTEDSGSMPLHLAVKTRNLEISRILLQSKKPADVNIRDSDGCTALFRAAWSGQNQNVDLLLQFHADTEAPDPRGWRPLHAAYDSVDITRRLLKAEAVIDSVTNEDETPLFIALTHGFGDVAHELISRGANPLAPTKSRRTPLHEAAAEFGGEIFQLMLNNTNQSVDVKDDRNRSPLSVAATEGRADAVEALLRRCDVDINQEESPDHTPLWLAVGKGHSNVVQALLESSKLNLPSSSESAKRLLWHAGSSGSPEVMNLLLKTDIRHLCDSNSLLQIAAQTENNQLINLASNCKEADSWVDQHGWSINWTKYVNRPAGEENSSLPEGLGNEFKLPSCWNELDESGVLEVQGDDGLVLSHKLSEGSSSTRQLLNLTGWRSRRWYTGDDSALARADHPIPPIGNFTFEIEVLDEGINKSIGIGFGHKRAPLHGMPGWNKFSWGYHGDDGKKFHGSGTGIVYSELYGEGDVIGCHLDQSKGTVYFTKNGEDLGRAFEGIRGRLYPMVGMTSPGAKIRARFAWDLQDHSNSDSTGRESSPELDSTDDDASSAGSMGSQRYYV